VIGLNCGSGQRPFGLPRRTPTPHNWGCAICGLSMELHGDRTRWMNPNTNPCEHSYLPVGSNVWINIDINPRWEPDLIADCNHLSMFHEASVDLVISHHCLEHVGCGEADVFIREAWRVLKPEGSLIVSVPDMRKLATLWLSGELTTQIYMTNVYGAYMGHEEDRHRWGFDSASLSEALRVAPWSQIIQFDWRPTPGANIARDDRWICVLECIK